MVVVESAGIVLVHLSRGEEKLRSGMKRVGIECRWGFACLSLLSLFRGFLHNRPFLLEVSTRRPSPKRTPNAAWKMSTPI